MQVKRATRSAAKMVATPSVAPSVTPSVKPVVTPSASVKGAPQSVKAARVKGAKTVKPATRSVTPVYKPAHFVRRNFKCKYCAGRFHFQRTYKSHVRKVHNLFACRVPHCLEAFITASVRTAHEAIHTVKWYECATCKAVFKHKSVRDRHLVQHGSDTSFKCEQCDHSYVRKADLTQHMKQKHFVVKKKDMFQCDKCDFATKTYRQLGYHKKTHAAVQIKCPVCPEKFHHYEARRRHMAKAHV